MRAELRDLEAERRVLSAMMHSEVSCIEVLSSLKDSDFADETNRSVFILCSDLFARGAKPTYAEVMKQGISLGFVSSRNMSEVQYISESFIDDRNISFWIDKVKDASKLRGAVSLLNKYNSKLQDGVKDVDSFIGEVSLGFFSLSMGGDKEGIDSPEEIAELGIALLEQRVEAYRKMEEACRILGDVPLEGVPSGFPTLDKLTLGFKPGDLIILGAQTGHGKTAFALNVAKAACLDNDFSTLYINTEMSKEQIARRWGAMLSNVAVNQIRSGSVNDEQKEKIIEGYRRLGRSKFYPVSIPNLTPHKLDVLARKAKIQKNVQLIVLDYVGRMEKFLPDMPEWQVLEQIIKKLKILAQTLEVACFVLVQLNEDGTLQGARRMKNECDLMLKLLQVDNETKERIESKYKKQYEDFDYRIYVDKSRDSESGITIPLVFDKGRQQITEAKEKADVWDGYERRVYGS